MWADTIVEYTAGFLFGLLIFQALFMRKMMGGTYLENVRRSFLPEFISMKCMMAGMEPVMISLMMSRDMRAMWPGEPLFWVVMSLGIVAGLPPGATNRSIGYCASIGSRSAGSARKTSIARSKKERTFCEL